MKFNINFNIKFLSMIPCIFIMVVIFIFSSRPAEVSSGDSMKVTQVIYKVYENKHGVVSEEKKMEVMTLLDHIVRKTAHGFIYCMLSISYCLPIYIYYGRHQQIQSFTRHYVPYVPAIGLAFLYACSDEFHQRFVRGRSCEWRDVMIDTLGATFGMLIFCLFLTLLYHVKKKNVLIGID